MRAADAYDLAIPPSNCLPGPDYPITERPMFVALVMMYFLLACFACWLLLFPGGRAIVLHTLVNLGWRVQRRAQHLKGGSGAQWQRVQRHTDTGMARAWQLLWQHRWLSLAGSVLVIVPPLLAWLSSDRIALRGYADQQHAINDQVSDLLKGEQLVPPPADPGAPDCGSLPAKPCHSHARPS